MNLDNFWSIFSRYCLWGVESLLIRPLLIPGLVSLGVVAVAGTIQRSKIRSNWQSSYWLIFTQLLFYPLVIAVGVALRADLSLPIRPDQHRLQEHILYAIVIISLVTGCFWIYYSKGVRSLAAGLVMVQEVMLMGALFIAGMSVTGDWI